MSATTNQAVAHLANQLCRDGRLAYLIGPGSQSYALLTEAFAAITGETVAAVRGRIQSRLRPTPIMDRELANSLDALLEAMADSECADPGRKYAPEALAAAQQAEVTLRRYREAEGR